MTTRRTVFFGLLAAIFALTFAACPEEDDPDLTPQTVTYRGTANGTTYTLTITENTAGRYTAKNGDSYVLTAGTKTSSGTVTVNGSTFTLTPSSSGASAFTVTVSSSGITGMSGTITFDDGSAEPAPASITPPSTDPKSVKIENITDNLAEYEFVGVWIFEALPPQGSWPTNTAIQYTAISGTTLSADLVVPRDNTYNYTDVDGQQKINANWTGNGDYYVAIVPSVNRNSQWNDARIFTGDGNTPVKVAFDEALITLDYSKFKIGPKSVKIENVNNNDFPGGQAGVFIFAALPPDSSMPTTTAIRYLYDVTSGTMYFDLVVPRDNTYEATNNQTNRRWTGNGDYYVMIVSLENYSFTDFRIFTNGGNQPVKVSFDKALITLDYSKFKLFSELQ